MKLKQIAAKLRQYIQVRYCYRISFLSYGKHRQYVLPFGTRYAFACAAAMDWASKLQDSGRYVMLSRGTGSGMEVRYFLV